jgi:hypothetical protein
MRFPAFLAILMIIHIHAFTREADTTRHIFTGIEGHYGFIIPHSEKISEFSGVNPAGISISYNRLHTSLAARKVFNSYRISGFEALYVSFRDPEILGSAFMFTAYAEPVIAHSSRYLFSVRGGAGFSYNSRIYDSIENPLNKFFSTRISFPLYISAKFSYRLNPNIFLTLAANYNHISNGGIQQPNTGMNFPTASVGIRYFHNAFPVLGEGRVTGREVIPGITLLIQALSGYRVVDKTEIFPEKRTFAFGLHLRASKHLKPFYSLNAGAEMISDGAIREMIRREGTSKDHRRLAVTAGQDFSFGRSVFTQYFGFYVYSPWKARNRMYEKYELAFKISPHFQAGVYIKAHAQVAELMGLNFSYLLYRKDDG